MKIKIGFARRGVQLFFFSLFLFLPILALYNHYLSNRQLTKVMKRWEGTLPGTLLKATDSLVRIGIPDGESGVPTRHPRKAILERTQEAYGSAWSFQIGNFSFTDLLAVTESAITSRTFVKVLLLGMIFPLIFTLLFGRIFCSWLCPMGFLFEMGQKLRGIVSFLELKPGSLKFWNKNKYILLVLGLVFSFFVGIPLLQSLYPPALLGRESQNIAHSLFNRAEAGRTSFALIGFTSLSLFLITLVAIDAFIAPRFWCTSFCPGGAIYAVLGYFRVFRVRRNRKTCTQCGECNRTCPMALHPMNDKTGIECDNCAACIDACPEGSLRYYFSLTSQSFQKEPTSLLQKNCESNSLFSYLRLKKVTVGLSILFLCFFFYSKAYAHHIIGLPHYAYEENYPQAPVLKLVELVGKWKFQLTAYPGNPVPGVRSEIHVYITEKQSGELLELPVTLWVHQQNLWGSDLVYGPSDSVLEENLYKFYVTFPRIGNYNLRLEFPDGDIRSSLEFPMVIGEPGSPWVVLGSFVGGICFLLLLIRALKIKRMRRKTLILKQQLQREAQKNFSLEERREG